MDENPENKQEQQMDKQERRELKRLRRQETKATEGKEQTKGRRMRLLRTGGLVVVVVVAGIYFALLVSTGSGSYDNFAKCLSDKGVVMYGNDWCSYTKEQNAMFGNAHKYLNYIRCDDNKDLCREKGVVKTPTWEYSGRLFHGVQSFQTLAGETGCSF